MKIESPAVPKFPPAWEWFYDECVTQWVKNKYSPQSGWVGKPFNTDDGKFFMRGIGELSEMFTDERPRQIPSYFQHSKFRSAYLLYFLPLQSAKFLTLFQLHEKAMRTVLAHGRKQGVLRIADLGAGPGTASIAFLMWILLLSAEDTEKLPPIEFLWIDRNDEIMKDGRDLALLLAAQYPRLKDKITIRFEIGDWFEAMDYMKAPYSLVLSGHLLNEIPKAPELKAFNKIFSLTSGGGFLFVEPAARSSAQRLSHLRDFFFEHEVVPAHATSLWGPCLHAGACPMRDGRDWCHFSTEASIPGKWFKYFSRGLGSEKHWVKYSYLWVAARDHTSTHSTKNVFRVISDRLGRGGDVLLCTPNRPTKKRIPASHEIFRGDILRTMSGANERELKPNIRPKPADVELSSIPREKRFALTHGKRNDTRGDKPAKINVDKERFNPQKGQGEKPSLPRPKGFVDRSQRAEKPQRERMKEKVRLYSSGDDHQDGFKKLQGRSGLKLTPKKK